MVNAEQADLLGIALIAGGAIAAATLTAVVHSLTGAAIPYVPPLGWVVPPTRLRDQKKIHLHPMSTV
jgi:hypothetical protein